MIIAMKRYYIILTLLFSPVFLFSQKSAEIVARCDKLMYSNLPDSALSIANKYIESKKKIKEEYLIVYFTRGKILQSLDNYNLATKDFSLIIDYGIDSLLEEAYERRAFCYYYCDSALYAKKNIEYVLKLNSSNERAWILLFLINSYNDYNYIDALFAINQLIKINPSSLNYFYRYQLNMIEGNIDKALLDLKDAYHSDSVCKEVIEEIDSYQNNISSMLNSARDSIHLNNFAFSYNAINDLQNFLFKWIDLQLINTDSISEVVKNLKCEHNKYLEQLLSNKLDALIKLSKNESNITMISDYCIYIELYTNYFYRDVCFNKQKIENVKSKNDEYFKWINKQDVIAKTGKQYSTPWGSLGMSFDDYMNMQHEKIRAPEGYNGKAIYTGKRGGKYYINKSGNKTYIKR
jgi:hypothetical protein